MTVQSQEWSLSFKSCNQYFVSHKSNPSSVPWSILDSHSTLLWATWEAVTGVGGCYDTQLANRVLSTQAKVEGVMPRATWQWGRDSRVINNPLGDPGHTSLYVGLLPAWVSVDGDLIFLLIL
jgi:hypothetical protein